MLQIVSATRGAAAEFRQTALGQSLVPLQRDERVGARIAVSNTRGLSEVYNEAIEAGPATGVEAFVFVHDDIWLRDPDFVDRLVKGLRIFDVVGVIGNKLFHPGHVYWSMPPAQLSGRVGLGDTPEQYGLHIFGEAPAPCVLLDGIFLAVTARTLKRSGLRFDPQFSFHFYDLDFCRSAYSMGLKLGTWPLDMIHREGSQYATPAWLEARNRYADKWRIDLPDRPLQPLPDTQKAG
jgi:GT2 family glycosyltransferase